MVIMYLIVLYSIKKKSINYFVFYFDISYDDYIQNTTCVQQLKNYISKRCNKAGSQFEATFNDSSCHIGFVISERFVNIPPQIAVPSYETLW